jgi:hypothetical protein
MRLRMYTGESKRERVQDHYREREKKVLAGPNSQDVWDERASRAKPEEFFTGDLSEVKGW